MPLNITHVDDAELAGKNKVKDFEKQFNQQFFGPVIDAGLSQMWQELPDPIKAAVLQANPQAAKRINKRFGGG